MSDKDKVILFPSDRIVNKQTAKQDPKATERVRLENTKEFVEGNVDEIAMMMLRKFVEMAMLTEKPEFTKDLGLLVDIMRGMIYRDFDVDHPAQRLADKIVDVKMTRFGPQVIIDYNKVIPEEKHKLHKPFSKDIKDEIKRTNDGWTDFEPDFETPDDWEK
jgi:hypothetical protein